MPRSVAGKHKKNQTAYAPPTESQLTIAERISWLIVAITTTMLPLAVTLSGKDVFRLPKHLLLEASGIVLASVAICSMLIANPLGRGKRWDQTLLVVVGAVMLWSAVTTLTSTNRILSIFSLVTVAAATMLFVATYDTVQSRSLAVLYVALAPALINAVLAIAQRTAVWNPFTLDGEQTARLRTTALLGNPDDVGMFLVAPTLAAAALAIASKRHRVPAIIIAMVLVCGMLASETLGAIIALSAGLFVLILSIRPRVAVIAALVALLLGTGFVRLSPARWSATRSKIAAAARGDVDPLLSGRLPAVLAAWRMFHARPLYGVGLGCFAFHYFDERIAVEMDHPSLLNRSVVNFGEAHNEHLQILAEGGLPAYGIFIVALLLLARISFRKIEEDGDARSVFAHRIALPLAVSIFTLTLSSFPLRLAAPTANTLFFCAITMAWSANARGR